MTHRRMTRALIALALPALLVPIAASPASAAPKAPDVPSLEAVTKLYPHLEGGSVDITREPKIRMPEECEDGAVIKGAVGREALYMAKLDRATDGFAITGKKPAVSVAAETFPSAKVASRYLRANITAFANCMDEEVGEDVKIKKVKFKLGAERWGFQVRMGTKKARQITNLLAVRSGKVIVLALSLSMTGNDAPSVPKTVELARLGLKTAR